MKFELESLKMDENGKEFCDYKANEWYIKITKEIERGLKEAKKYALLEEKGDFEYAQEETMALLKIMRICATRIAEIENDCEDSLDCLCKSLIRE